MSKRKIINEQIKSLDISFFDGEINNIIDNLTQLKYDFDNYLSLSIQVYQCYEEVTIELYGKRVESDKEYNKRIAEELKKEKLKLARANKRKENQEKKIQEAKQKIENIRKKYNLPDNLDVETLKSAIKELEG